MSEITKTERGIQIVANIATILSALRGIAYGVIILGLPFIAYKALPLLDRAVVVLERLDERVDEAFEGLRPVGQETVKKGVETLQSVDAKEVGKSFTDAIKKRLGR